MRRRLMTSMLGISLLAAACDGGSVPSPTSPPAPNDPLAFLAQGLATGNVRVIDLTQVLSPTTPIIQLPPPFANTPGSSSMRSPTSTPKVRRGTGTGSRWASMLVPTSMRRATG
jgi:hypothetical protein